MSKSRTTSTYHTYIENGITDKLGHKFIMQLPAPPSPHLFPPLPLFTTASCNQRCVSRASAAMLAAILDRIDPGRTSQDQPRSVFTHLLTGEFHRWVAGLDEMGSWVVGKGVRYGGCCPVENQPVPSYNVLPKYGMAGGNRGHLALERQLIKY